MAVELDETSGSMTYTDDGRVAVLKNRPLNFPFKVMAVELDETSGSLTYTDDGRVTVLKSCPLNCPFKVMAVELEETSGSLTYTDDGRVTVLEGHDFHLSVIGRDLSNSTYIKLVTSRYRNTGSVVTFFKQK